SAGGHRRDEAGSVAAEGDPRASLAPRRIRARTVGGDDRRTGRGLRLGGQRTDPDHRLVDGPDDPRLDRARPRPDHDRAPVAKALAAPAPALTALRAAAVDVSPADPTPAARSGGRRRRLARGLRWRAARRH